MNTIHRRTFLVQSLAGIGVSVLPSFLKAGESGSIPTYGITDVVKSSENDFLYYRVDAPGTPFHIVTKRESTLLKPFTISDEYKTMGKPFPRSTDSNKPVAFVEGGKLGLNGNIEVYDNSDGYGIRYNFSPILQTPSHTSVRPGFLFKTDNAIKRFPPKLVEQFINRGIKISLGKDVESTYYHFYPGWKIADVALDKTLKAEGNLPVISTSNCNDRRKRSQTAAIYGDKNIMIPQIHETYPVGGIVDLNEVRYYSMDEVVAHELFHALDDFNNDYYINSKDPSYANHKKQYIQSGYTYARSGWYSDTQEYINAYEIDKQRMPSDLREELAYQFCGRKESFADVGSSLLGLRNPESTKRFLRAFPMCAEYVRKNILGNEFGVSVSVQGVRDFCPDYLKDIPTNLAGK
jgi:hypothetical protein